MKHTLLLLALAVIGVALTLGLANLAQAFRSSLHRAGRRIAVNVAEGTHCKALNRLADAAVATRHLLAKLGSDADHFNVCGVATCPLGTIPDEVATAEVGERRAIWMLGGSDTHRMIASGAITAGGDVYTAASGKVQAQPAAAGTYYKVGRACNTTSADGDTVEVDSCKPVLTTVIATAPTLAQLYGAMVNGGQVIVLGS